MNMSNLRAAALGAGITLLAVWAFGQAHGPATSVKLENAKVKVSEVSYAPGVPRQRFIRQHDQVIVFLDDSRYERTDSGTHEKTVRERKSGEVIWHDKGEDAPQLINLGSKTYRTIVIELK
jgi:hypothetical protein